MAYHIYTIPYHIPIKMVKLQLKKLKRELQSKDIYPDTIMPIEIKCDNKNIKKNYKAQEIADYL